MCGLVGAAGRLDSNAMSAFKDMLYFDAVRGRHSTGVAVIPRSDPTAEGTILHKAPVDANTFLSMPYTEKVLRSPSTLTCVIGHNRHATLGDKNYDNSHPFLFDELVGAHNGTVAGMNRKDIPYGKKEDEPDFGTDSQTLLASIARYGPEETFSQIYDGTWSSSAWAMTWFNFEEGRVNFIRNQHRPLCFAFSKDEKQLFWSSEVGILRAALWRNSVEFEKVFILPENHLFDVEVPKTYNSSFNTKDLYSAKGGGLAGRGPKPSPKTSTINTKTGKEYGSYKNNIKNISDYRNFGESQGDMFSQVAFDTLDEVLHPFGGSVKMLTKSMTAKNKKVLCFSCGKHVTDAKDVHTISGKKVWCTDCSEKTQKNIADSKAIGISQAQKA